ncbi:MAG: dipeptide epimerase [Bacteroidetes bacterium]|nr:dipeptide epimerase [Bacteroidota bacterium]MCW5897119.1 dipeptide epimerase [Bacteroidota bacterium]
MQLRFSSYTLELRHAFTVSTYSRTTTPVMIVEAEEEGIIGYGEASMPPYLGETPESATTFLSRVDLDKYANPAAFDDILKGIDAIAPGNHAAKAAVDIALHDWLGKKLGFAWHQAWGLDPSKTPVTTFTIGIESDKDLLRQRVREADTFKVLKVKLGSKNDTDIVTSIRQVTDKPLRVDVNQGWKNKEKSLEMIQWLSTQGVELVEQPLPKEMIDEQAWLKERSPLPIIADEAVSRLSDIANVVGLYDGINIKLMKCTGMHEAYMMILLARALDLKVMLGCMTETSCAISAATQLSPLADYADLDGAALISNDPFAGTTIAEGKLNMPGGFGIGVSPKH